MKSLSKIVLVASMFVSVLTYQMWKYLLDEYDIQVFYIGMSLLFMGLSFVIFNETKRQFKLFSELVFLMSVNNFVDELFFDPEKFSEFEIVVFVGILINFIFKWNNWKKR